MIPVHVVSEDEAVAGNLCRLLEAFSLDVSVVADAGSYLAEIMMSGDHVAVISMDLSLYNGLDVLNAAVSTGKASYVFAVADNPPVQQVVQAMRIGVSDVLEQPVEVSGIVSAARDNPQHTGFVAGLPTLPEGVGGSLTKREKQILAEVIQAKSNQQIAGIFQISKRTVEAHRSNILKKFNVKNQAELMRAIAVRNKKLI